LNFSSLSELLAVIRNGHIAIARFGGQSWHILKLSNVIYYYDPVDKAVNGIAPLTRSNIEAEYEIVNDS
jgi:hypothetical protein